MNGKRGRKEIGPLDDAFQLFACVGRRESAVAVEISGLKEVLF